MATRAFAADEPSAPTPQQQAISRQIEGVEDALRQSSDLRARIVYSTTMESLDESDPTKGVSVRELIPTADLVDQTRGATDPLVLDLMVQHCQLVAKPGSGCDAMEFARRWTEADTQNQLAWLTLASMQEKKGDRAGARATFVRAAQASSWHEHDFDLARFVVGQFPDAVTAGARNAILASALGRGVALSVPYMLLGTYCKEDGDVRAACARIVATLFRDTETMMGLTLAAPFAKRAHVDSSIVASYLQESDAVRWAMQSLVQKDSGRDDPSMSDEATLIRENARLQALIDIGERRLGERILLKQHISKSEAASRYVATMTPWQLKQRADLLAMR